MAEDVENKIEDQATEESVEAAAAGASDELKMNALFAYKEGMSTVYDENGRSIVVTVLRYEPWYVSQIKTLETDGYEAVQIASSPKKAKNAHKAEVNHFKAAGFENGARLAREIKPAAEDVKVGRMVSINSLAAGDTVKLEGFSKGRGFSGVIKRWGFGGGPASHGSKFHRQPGSIGNRTWPGRVMPGRKLPGQFGNKKVNVKNVQVVSVHQEEGAILVKGPVPGSRHSLVQITKM